jgi:hypothetical protein
MTYRLTRELTQMQAHQNRHGTLPAGETLLKIQENARLETQKLSEKMVTEQTLKMQNDLSPYPRTHSDAGSPKSTWHLARWGNFVEDTGKYSSRNPKTVGKNGDGTDSENATGDEYEEGIEDVRMWRSSYVTFLGEKILEIWTCYSESRGLSTLVFLRGL